MNTPSSQKTVAIVVGIVILLGVFFAGLGLGRHQGSQIAQLQVIGANNTDPNDQVDMTLFWKAWNIINQSFVQTHGTSTVTNQDRVYGAIEGMVSAMGDPYTTFFPPTAATAFETEIDGDFQGIGMEMGLDKNGVLTVISALKGSPAEAAGIKTGDEVTKINGRDATNMDIDDAVKLIRGKAGTTVSLEIVRDGVSKPLDFTLTRQVINLPTVDTNYDKTNGIFTIKIYTFDAQAQSLFRDALRQFVNTKSDKLIIDLRGNPGGYLDAAVDIGSWFLPAGKVIVREDYGQNKPETDEVSKGYDIFNNDLKMVLLVDGGSASASEILSGALSEYGKAKLVGTQTFGKGSVQDYIKLTPDTALKVTIARWLTPNGKSISQQGITPDYVVPMTDDDVKAGRDPQMAAAVDVLLGQPVPVATSTATSTQK